jgi:hypothetical protein
MLGLILEWCGCVLGLVGAGLLALDISISRYGWLWFLAANVFTVTSLLGVWRAFGPRRSQVRVYSE